MKRKTGGSAAPRHGRHRPHSFMFATGIENSYPVVTGKDGRDLRVDEMAKCRHYELWRVDFRLVKELGLEYLRYGPPYYREHVGPGRYDWEFADETLGELRRLGIPDRGPLSLRGPGLGRELSESGLAAIVRRVRGGVRAPL